MKKLGRNELFEMLGCRVKNPRWSWCAMSHDQTRAIFTIWKDQIRSGISKLTPTERPGKKRHGAIEQKKILELAFRRKIAVFGLQCVAKDIRTSPRTIESIDSQALVKLKLFKKRGQICGRHKGRVLALELVKTGAYRGNRKSAVDDLGEAPSGNGIADRAKRMATFIRRDSRVRAYVLKRAKGACEHCGSIGFETSSGSAYLEAHHVIALCDEGKDTVGNVIALCPGDHRRAHFGKDARSLEAKFINKLIKMGQRKRTRKI